MRPMNSRLAISLFCIVCSAQALAAPVAPPDVLFDGVIEPYGKRCAGTLKVKPKTVEWNARFGHCKPAAYEVVEQNRSGKNERSAYRLSGWRTACAYSVMVLEYKEATPDYWTASWYKTAEDFRNGNEDLQCPVVRLDRSPSSHSNR